MITKIDTNVEAALREALSAVARLEEDQIEPALAVLDDRQRAEALALTVLITGYIAIDVSGSHWPTKTSVREIAESLATNGKVAKRFQLDSGKIHEYLSRVVLGSDRLQDVLPDEPEFTRFPIIVADQALGAYCPKDMEIWDYVDQIESAIEIVWALKSTVLPAAVMRSYMPKAKTPDQANGA